MPLKGLGWITLLIAACAIVFFPVWNPAQQDLAGGFDVYRQFVPANHFFDASLHMRHGEIATWNPLLLSGMPHAADPQTWTFYPPNLLRAWLNRGAGTDPSPTAFGLTILMGVHLLWLGAGTFVLARRHDLSPPAAALATIGTLFGALLVRRAAEFHFLFTLAWFPWILFLLEGVLRAERRSLAFRDATLLGVCAGMSALGGFAQIVPQMAIAAGAYTVARLVHLGPRRAVPVPLALAVVLATGIAACLVLPASELIELGGRSAGANAVSGHLPEEWSLAYAWRSLAVYPGRIYEPETVRGAGIGVLALALAGLVARTRRALPFVVGLYALIDLMLGPPFPLALVLDALTPFEMVSRTRAMDVAMLPIALLAGHGLDAFRDTRSGTRTLAAAVSLVVGGLALAQLGASLRGGIWLEPSPAVWLVPALALGALAAATLVSKPRLRAVLLAAVPCLAFVEIAAWNARYVPALVIRSGHDAELSSYLSGCGDVSPFGRDNRRAGVERYNYQLHCLEAAMNGYNPLHLRRVRDVLSGPERGREYRRAVRVTEIPQRNARGDLLFKRSFWLADTVVRAPLPAKSTMFPPTRYVFLEDDTPVPADLRAVAAEQVPRSAVADGAPPFAAEIGAPSATGENPRLGTMQRFDLGEVDLEGRHAALEVTYATRVPADLYPYYVHRNGRRIPGLMRRLEDTSGNPARVVVPLPDLSAARVELETASPPGSVSPTLIRAAVVFDTRDENDRIEIVSRGPDRVEVRLLDLPGTRVLVFLDAYYPGWHASIDGTPAEILRAHDAFKAVVVPAGSHTVVFRFSSRRVHAGVLFSILTWLSAAVVLVLTSRRRVS